MSEHSKTVWVATWVVVCLALAAPGSVWAQPPKPEPPPDSQDKALAAYLATARQVTPVEPNAWMNGLTMDLRARKVNDIVTVRVLESISASGTADSSIGKSTNTAVGIATLAGLETQLPTSMNPAELVAGKSDTGFKGSGATTRTSALTATLSARVAEVLPSGDLVIEGVREIEVNGDRQVVVLTGVARVADIGPGNVVSSAALGQLSIRYFGRGLTKDSLSPGWLIRILNKVF